jgi:purine nucleosidase
MSIAIDAAVCTSVDHHYTDVEVESELTRGMTVVDQLRVTKQPPNVEICWKIDARRWKETLYKTLR